jgi:tetratricopeptide (TPR) repeat protein
MIKKLFFLIALTFTLSLNSAQASSVDTSYTEELNAFDWTPISDADKIMQYEKQKNLTKRSIDQAKLAAEHYISAVTLMKNKEFQAAIKEFQAAMKRYKRAKLSADAMNFIHTNMALCYANSANKQDLTQAERRLNLITPKAYNDDKWAYNIAIAHSLVGNQDQAASLLSSLIRKDQFNFQSYITLEAIYRNSGNEDEADRVIKRMNTAEDKLIKKKQKAAENNTQLKEKNGKKKNKFIVKGKKPDITNLKIIKANDHLQFNKVEKIDERSMIQIQEGISDYNKGIKSLAKRENKIAQTFLKNAEKKLKRGKITDDGLNFVRGNLVISYLATEDKRGVGQAKRHLKALTLKLYNTREWTYNMAIAYYQFAFMSARENKKEGTRKWTSPTAAENLKASIKLFQKSIKQDKLFLPAYENLIYIYKEQSEDKKAENLAIALKKARLKLMQSFSKEEQVSQGGDSYIFRLNLGIFGSFDTPSLLFDESNVIAIPMSEGTTAYLSGLFYSSDAALDYQKRMNEKGYTNSFIVAYKDGEAFTEF